MSKGNLLDRIDNWLIEKIYQPVVNRLAHRCSCFDLSIYFGEIYLLVSSTMIIKNIITADSSGYIIINIVVLVLTWIIFTNSIRLCKKQNAESSNKLNPLILRFKMIRECLCILIVILPTMDLIRLYTIDNFTINYIDRSLLFIAHAHFYFAACFNTPKPTAIEKKSTIYKTDLVENPT